jgi:hypothetical protein
MESLTVHEHKLTILTIYRDRGAILASATSLPEAQTKTSGGTDVVNDQKIGMAEAELCIMLFDYWNEVIAAVKGHYAQVGETPATPKEALDMIPWGFHAG